MSIQEFKDNSEMKMLLHHIYEYQKGVRRMVLCTVNENCADIIKRRLNNLGICFFERSVGSTDRVNLFFGEPVCLDAVRNFVDKPLNKLTPEEDFMLGALLGYDLSKQCERYCKKCM